MARRAVVDPRFPSRLRALRRERGLSLRSLARLTYLGKSYLHDFETGARTPTRERAAQLDDALKAGGELAVMVGDGDDDPLGYAVAHPRRADRVAVAKLAVHLAAARRQEDRLGAAAMLPCTTGQLAVVTDLMREACGALRPRIASVSAQWAQFAGWLNLARGRRLRAGALLDQALEWATEADDREMVATVLSFKGHAGWLAGQLGPTIGLTEAALRDPTVYVGQRAYDMYQLARARAAVGDRDGAVAAIAAGSDLAAESMGYTGPRPPWHYYKSRAFFLLEAGLAHAQLGGHARAADLLRQGLAGLPPELREADWVSGYRDTLADNHRLSAAR